MFSPSDSPNQTTATAATTTTTSLGHLLQNIFSYDGNIMLAAVVSLLVVILFVLILHLYAKWFLAQARHRRRRSMTVSHVLGPSRFHHFHTFSFDTTLSNSPTKGLENSVIATIPLFVYNSEEHKHELECVICLSPFEENDVGRDLPKCHHAFHVECIDMWLSSHSSCPICRAPAVCEANDHGSSSVESLEVVVVVGADQLGLSDGDSAMETVIDIPSCENETEDGLMAGDSLSVSSSSSSSSQSSSSSLGCSLKRMLSRNRSERKVFPSSINVNEFNA